MSEGWPNGDGGVDVVFVVDYVVLNVVIVVICCCCVALYNGDLLSSSMMLLMMGRGLPCVCVCG